MAAGTEVSKLYLTLGLNLDDLALDFSKAQNSLRSEIAKLNSENSTIKLKTQLDMASLGSGASAIDRLKVQEQSLTQQIEIQQRKVELLGQAYRAAYEQYGASKISTRAENQYLRQAAQLEKLKSALASVNAEQQKLGAGGGGKFSALTSGAENAAAALGKVSSGYSFISTKAAAAMAVATTGAGLFNITDKAMQAGNNLYMLSKRLQVSTSEAANFSRVFQVAGVDVGAAIPAFARLDKQLMSTSGESGQLAMTLAEFGVSLKDSAGNLLPINQQLAALAEGYQRAAAAGKEQEYVTQTLGARGAALIPLLQDYNMYMQIAASIKTTGLLDPDEARKTYIEWVQLKAEAGQLSLALGSALMPIAKEMMPEVADAMKDLISTIRDNKDDIKDGIAGWAAALKGVAEIAGEAALAVGKVGSAVGKVKRKQDYDEDVLKANGKGGELNRATLAGTVIGGIGGGKILHAIDVALNRIRANVNGDWDAYVANYDKQKQALEEAEQAAAKEREEKEKGTEAEKKNSTAANENASAQQKAAEAVKWRTSAVGQLNEAIYSLTHNDNENAIHQMYVEAEKYLSQGIDPNLVNKFIDAKSTRIAEDFRNNVTEPMAQAYRSDLGNALAEVDVQARQYLRAGASQEDVDSWVAAKKEKINADWDNEVASQINSIWHSSYENRIAEIEREKKAWIQKGLEEVTATRWAEEEKRQLQQDTATQMLTSQRKMLQAMRRGMRENGVQGAYDEMLKQARREAGIRPGDEIKQAEIPIFGQLQKMVKDNLAPIAGVTGKPDFSSLQQYTYEGVYGGTKQAMIEVLNGVDSRKIPVDDSETAASNGRLFTEQEAQAIIGAADRLNEVSDKLAMTLNGWIPIKSNNQSNGQATRNNVTNISLKFDNSMLMDERSKRDVANKVLDTLAREVDRTRNNSYGGGY